jgi:hypothetical protein
MYRKLIPALLLFAPLLHAQTWVTIVPSTQQTLQTVVTVPAGDTYQQVVLPSCPLASPPAYAPITVTVQTNVVDYPDGANGRPPDSCPRYAKVFQIAETAVQQTINWTINGVAQPPVTVPALPAPPVTVSKQWCVTALPTVCFSLMSDGTFQLNGTAVAIKETK